MTYVGIIGVSGGSGRYIDILWRFPKMGVPLNHPFQSDFHGFSIDYQPFILGYTHLWKPPYDM
jgi:hypothetical protein